MFPVLACAVPDSKLPNELIYEGKPIDPLCLFEIEDTKGVVDLRKCGLNAQKGHQVAGKNKKLMSEGFNGYDYSYNINYSKSLGGYSYYKVFGNVGNSVIVQTVNNSGGTGDFSFLNLVQREGNIIKITVLNGGDRCNGAVDSIKRKGEHLVYSVRLTAYDYLTLAQDNPHHLKAYDDLSSCAVCCAGIAVYQRDIVSNFANEKLLYIDASNYLKDIDNASPSQPYQACFDKVLKQYAQKNNGKLNAKQLSLFTHQFNTKCVKNVSMF